ncbi:ELMO domain-containing protein 2-like [Ruditapes philippinarum]|uniref:ELMO domain-containing protein 2-like n=1 Tax=Ruditapes philippinarum TaxID=129788 RepID=UPI00295BEF2A|nr:ELMO domain-containing protein 2-like [Ruditapes philippinarum]XP_060581415.1 ELMO domain-containing protein 2-like [Ruditapes philippinarum]XP_060581416.1 ELMO domain-containing protein 2-like [Ruditapes philippinarum]
MLQALWASLVATLYVYLRPMFKWIIRRVTGKCELLRITYQYPKGAARTKYVEYSLRHSSQNELKRLVKETDTNIEAAVVLVMKTKMILPEVHSQFEHVFRQCLTQINGYIRLQHTVETIRQVKYSSENSDHEDKLMKLWTVLTDGEKLTSRTSSQWSQLGFQGTDPQTDFRGMGQLGLDQLLYFATKYTAEARSMLSKSHNQYFGYSFAIVGINLTELVYTLLRYGNLRSHFYNSKTAKPTLEDFHEVYCYVFYNFDSFWFAEKPKDIMEFGRLREKYRKKLVAKLREKDTIFTADFQNKQNS